MLNFYHDRIYTPNDFIVLNLTWSDRGAVIISKGCIEDDNLDIISDHVKLYPGTSITVIPQDGFIGIHRLQSPRTN